MTSSTLYFTGFNGFGQLKNLPKINTSFKELTLESVAPKQINKIHLKCLWNYFVYANGNELYICGYLNGNCYQERRFPFEYPIKDLACTENVCIVLLNIGIAYKIDCQTLDVNDLNPKIIQRSSTHIDAPVNISKIFGKFSTQVTDVRKESENEEFITHIAAGRSLSIVITNKNNVYNMPLKIYTFPAHVKIEKVCCGNEHCLILTTNGDLYAFGSSSRGQLGLGGLESVEEPLLVEALAGIKMIDVAAGGWHSVAVSAFNDLYAWGWNVNGQLGLPLFKTIETIQKNGEKITERQKCATVFASPVIVDLPKDSSVSSDDDVIWQNEYYPVAVSAGTRHTVVKIDNGTLMASGWNKYGQLACNKCDEDFDHFHQLDKNVTANGHIICGDWSTFIILAD